MSQDVGNQININPLDLDNNVAIGVVFPFNGNAIFNSSFTTKDQIKSNLINVLLTEPGERVMEPNFGIGLKNLLFEQSIDLESLKETIQEQINMYIPHISLLDIGMGESEDKHTIFISLVYVYLLDNSQQSIQLNFN